MPFMAFAFEGGYVWSPHRVSVANKEVKQPFQDDEYANAMHALEHLVGNFCADHLTDAEKEDQEEQRRRQQAQAVPHQVTSPHAWLSY
jgi:ssRNA-specific RNase YbeY (16S rRNA maturation enzyme)